MLERALITQQRIQPLGADGNTRRRRTGLITTVLGLSPVLENAALHTPPAGETDDAAYGERARRDGDARRGTLLGGEGAQGEGRVGS